MYLKEKKENRQFREALDSIPVKDIAEIKEKIISATGIDKFKLNDWRSRISIPYLAKLEIEKIFREYHNQPTLIIFE